jgi:hypothetical protein
MVTPSDFIVVTDISGGIGLEKEGVLRKLIVRTVDFHIISKSFG